ncbi:MAG: hypothetical protein ACRD03_14275, partial [Acidimicrobiales bacterium]
MPLRTRLLVALLAAAAASLVPVPMALGAPATRLDVLEEPGGPGGEAVAFPATHLALSWQGDDDARVQVRWSAGGGWGAWEDVAVAHDLEDHDRGVVYSGLALAPGATRVQARV